MSAATAAAAIVCQNYLPTRPLSLAYLTNRTVEPKAAQAAVRDDAAQRFRVKPPRQGSGRRDFKRDVSHSQLVFGCCPNLDFELNANNHEP